MNRLWVRILFVTSLVVNVFLIGAAVGVLVLGAQMRDRRPPPPGAGPLWRASLALPAEEGRQFRQALRREAMAMRPQVQANRIARQEAWAMGARDPFDPAAVKAALALARAGDNNARARLEERLVDLAAALPPEQRREIFRVMAEPPPRGRRGLRGRGGGPPPEADPN